MGTDHGLSLEIEKLHKRNRQVERDKSWETSKTRRISLMLITYVVAVLLLSSIGATDPLLSALFPPLGYLISTLSLPLARRYWERYFL